MTEAKIKEKFKTIQEIVIEMSKCEKGSEEAMTKYWNAYSQLLGMSDWFFSSNNEFEYTKLYDLYNDIIQEVLKKYTSLDNAEKPRTLENYFNFLWKRRKNNIYKKSKIEMVSDEIEDDSEDGSYLQSDGVQFNEWAEKDRRNTEGLDFSEKIKYMSELGISICRLCENKSSKNVKKYFPLLYSNLISYYFRLLNDYNSESDISSIDIKHENQIFATMNVDFLDSYTMEVCRTLEKLAQVEYKKNRDFGIEEDPDKELKAMPLHSKVFYAFVVSHYEEDKGRDYESVKSTLSQLRTKFNRFLTDNGVDVIK